MSLQACADLVRKGDPDRFLAAMAAPPAARRVLFPLYAFNVEVSRAPWLTSESMIAEMRLQWWRDVLEEIRAGGAVRRHEVVDALVPVLDAEGAAQLYTARFALSGGRLRLKPFVALPSIPPGGYADVTFVTGYGAAADVPEDLVQALKRLVLAAYGREAGEALPEEVTAILAARRERRI